MPTHPSHHDPGNGPSGTTRTRLPESGGYATPRRSPARASRTLVTVVGIVVLLVAALAFATRGGSGNSPARTGATGTDGRPAPGPHATPTTPTGTRPVTTSTSGIPTGYPHTTQGAQSAAANYAVALGGDGMFRTDDRHRIVDTVYAPAVLKSRRAALDAAYTDAGFLKQAGLNPDGTAPQGTTFVSRTVPAGSKLVSGGSDRPKVAVWCLGLAGFADPSSTKPVASSWFTITLTLTWQSGDWKILDFRQTGGPTPVTGDDRISGSDAITQAVQGYGGFTYAR